MVAVTPPDEEELYLLAILDGADGIDLAEFSWVDDEKDTSCFRVWPFQWPWYTCTDVLQIDQCSRSVGKTIGVTMRAYAFPFAHPGQEMLITAPELNHLRPLVDAVEGRLLGTRMGREMLPNSRGKGIARQPQWQARFSNGARIISRLPNKDGKGVKGMHPLVLEADEMQDYPLPGWIELIETLKRGSAGAQWRCHGVTRGVRDKYYELTQPDSGFTVHRWMAMHRPTWSDQERSEKIKTYGGSRQNHDYKRNIYGEHGDATNPVFVLARLMACVDTDQGSEFNTEVYHRMEITHERLLSVDNPGGQPLETYLAEIPGTHLTGHAKAPGGYSAYWGGMDVGLTNHPSEILILGQRAGTRTEHLDLLLRVHLQRIQTDDQIQVVKMLFARYGGKLKGFGIDRTGLGFPIYQQLKRLKSLQTRVHGYNFSEKVAVGFEDRELERDETMADLAQYRDLVEHATDTLRNSYVDPHRITLPFDRELLTEWQGQSYTIQKSAGSPYGKRVYSQGSFHTLDAAKMFAAAKTLPPIEAMLDTAPTQEPVLEAFVDMM